MYICGLLGSSPHRTYLNTLFSNLSPHSSRPRRVSHRGQQTVWVQEAHVWRVCLYSPRLPAADITNQSQLSETNLASESFPVWFRHPLPNKQTGTQIYNYVYWSGTEDALLTASLDSSNYKLLLFITCFCLSSWFHSPASLPPLDTPQPYRNLDFNCFEWHFTLELSKSPATSDT